MKVVWSPLAVMRVEERARQIAREAPAAARKWTNRMFDRTAQLADFPMSGRVVPELERDDTRELIEGDYRIIYRVSEGRVAVFTVRHGHRLLSDEDLT